MTELKKLFVLEKEDIDIVDYCTRQMRFKSQSAFVRWLLRNYYHSLDVTKEIEQNDIKQKELEAEMEKIKLKREELERKAEFKKLEDAEKQKKIDEVVENMANKIMNNTPIIELKEMARYWGFRLNMDGDELIAEANRKANGATIEEQQ